MADGAELPHAERRVVRALDGPRGELVLVAAFIYLPPFQTVIGTAPFPAWIWIALLGLSPLLLIIDEVRKALLRRKERS